VKRPQSIAGKPAAAGRRAPTWSLSKLALVLTSLAGCGGGSTDATDEAEEEDAAWRVDPSGSASSSAVMRPPGSATPGRNDSEAEGEPNASEVTDAPSDDAGRSMKEVVGL
jgi:hypothetical protein